MAEGRQAKYRPYPAYKSSGVEWLGDIPKDWKSSKLKYEAEFQVGWTPPTKSDENFVGANKWANISDLGPHTINDTVKRISDLAAAKASMSITPADSLLYSFKLSVGAVSFAGTDMYTNEAIASFLPSSAIPLAYLYYALPVFVIQNASTNIYGARILNQELIRGAVVAAPPFEAATKIATFLDHETAKIDALIAKQERLISLLEEKRQAVVNNAVTTGLNPNAPIKVSGVDWVTEIPAHWKIVPLLAVSEVIDPNPSHRNPEYVDEGFPFISTQEFIGRDEIITDTPRRVSEKTVLEQEARCNFQVGSIVFSRKGTIGATRVLPAGVRLGILDSLCVINPVREILPEFLADTLTAYYVAAQYGPIVNGAALPQLSVGKVRSLKLILPPHDEQMQIVRYLDEMLEKHEMLISRAQSAITLLKERRTALISAAVTGKIDVRNWQPQKNTSDQDTAQKAFA